jgi:tetratricopeptide (TPR) repeat protein
MKHEMVRLFRWFFRPPRLVGLVGLAVLLVVAALALGVRARWNGTRSADHFAQGCQAVKQGDADLALAKFTEAIRLDPRSVEALRERARILIRRDRWEEAVVDLDAALQLVPGDSELHVLRAETYAGRGREQDRPEDLDRAITDANKALDLDPGQALAHCHRALAYSAKFDDAKALADADEAVQQVPNDARVFFTRGRVRAGCGEDRKALDDFSEAIRLDPNYARAFAWRGLSQFELHEDAAALADCNRAVELASRDGRVYCCRARVYREDRRHNQELADLDRAVELNPRDLFSYFQRAACHAKRHDVRRAFVDCAAALAINPDSSLALAVRSVCHLERGRKKKALADMEKALALRPNYPVLRCLSAAFYQLEDEPDKALAEWDLALKGGNPSIARLAHPARATSYLQKGDSQRALADCDQALMLDPKSVEAYAIRSVAYSQAGEADRARADFNAALKLDKRKTYVFRAETFDLLKRDHEAIAELTEAIKIAPEKVGPYRARAVAYLAPLFEPAAMGVAVNQNSLVIGTVVPNLPAAKAGVRAGDKIVRVGSLQPNEFNQVVEHVATFRPGARLELEVERNGQRMVFPLVLADRPLNLRNPDHTGRKPQAERALSDCKRAVELDPEDPRNHRLLAEAYDLLDRHDEAYTSACKALQLDPEDPLAHLVQARIHLALKSPDKAIAEANEALRLEAEGGLPYLLRGAAFADKHEQEKAKADLARAAQLDPRMAGVKEAYEQQLAEEKAAQPWHFPIDNFKFKEFKDLKLPEQKSPFATPASEPFRWPSGDTVAVVLGIGVVLFVIMLLAGYRKAKTR